MDHAAHRIAECSIHHLMALQRSFACKVRAYDEGFKVRVVSTVNSNAAALQSGSD